jgi:putative membrane protein
VIVRDRPPAWRVFFIVRGSIVPRILPQILFVAGLSVAIMSLSPAAGWHVTPVAPVALSVIGAALSIFAAFRNSACYERWWEARKALGHIVVEVRNLARGAQSYVSAAHGDAAVWRFSTRCIAFVALTRDLLRGTSSGESAQYLSQAEREIALGSRNAPNRVLDFMSADIAAFAASQRLAPQLAQALETFVSGLSSALAALERTRATPMPFTYTLLLHRTAYLFCLLLPFGLADTAGWWTPLLAAVVSYTFFGLDAMGDELESPFGTTGNCLPLDAICRTVEIDILQSLGAADVPEPMRPRDFVLT